MHAKLTAMMLEDCGQGRTGHLDFLEKAWLVHHQRISVRLSDVDSRQKEAPMQSFFAYNKPKWGARRRVDSRWQAKR